MPKRLFHRLRFRADPAAWLSLCLLATVAAGAGPALYLNEDYNCFFAFAPIDANNAGQRIDELVDTVAKAGVTVYVCNTNSRRTNYRSKVWDAAWDGYDPEGPDDQPFLRPAPPNERKLIATFVGNMLLTHKQGVDYPARVIHRCRQRGISPWISLRMNDCHDGPIRDHPMSGTFWQKHPRYRRKHCTGYFSYCLDYARPQVRDFFMSLIVETLDRYDIDGLELDFMREPYPFSGGKESAGATLLTAWMKEVRRKVDAAAARRGHPVKLAARVPSHPETARNMGLDAVAWAKAGVIDVLIPSPRWATMEFDIPIDAWRAELGQAKTLVLGCVELNYQPCPLAPRQPATPELATGDAAALLSRGADAIYLFNYHLYGVGSKQHGDWAWGPELFIHTLKPMAALKTVLEQPRRVGLTYRDTLAPEERYQPPLPAEGVRIQRSLCLGFVPENSGPCRLRIGLAGKNGQIVPVPTVTVNGSPCTFLGDRIEPGDLRVMTFDVSRSTLAHDQPSQEITIVAGNASPLTIALLEMTLAAP